MKKQCFFPVPVILIVVLFMLPILTNCSVYKNAYVMPEMHVTTSSIDDSIETSTMISSPTNVDIKFNVELQTSVQGQQIYLEVLDDVTGLSVNPQSSFIEGSLVKYRYSSSRDEISIEHTPSGKQIRFRMYYSITPGEVKGIASSWSDNLFRLLINLYALDNNIYGLSEETAFAPLTTRLSDGSYYIILSLPPGFGLRYKYTLGNGFLNSKLDSNGNINLRQIIVPSSDVDIDDRVDKWYVDDTQPLKFQVSIPENTPIKDAISIQFNPSTWMEPVTMWKTGLYKWEFVLYNLLQNRSNMIYCYCQNDADLSSVWWQSRFDQYRTFLLHFANIAQENGVKILVIGDDSRILPALPHGKLPIGIKYPSHTDATLGYVMIENHCTPFDVLDQPIIFTQEIQTDMNIQYKIYEKFLNVINHKQWISGFVSRGYYSPVELHDFSASVRGKPTAALLWYWFPRLISPVQ